MKAFHFRLDQARRWRQTQVDVAESAAAAVAAGLASTRQEAEAQAAQMARTARTMTIAAPDGCIMHSWSSWELRMKAGIAQLRRREIQQMAELEIKRKDLAEANRKLHLLENLKAKSQANWTADFARELETFAAESFLGTSYRRKSQQN